jgi:beta-phosphoglucomutase-like phosphatase (HAD superfamily)
MTAAVLSRPVTPASRIERPARTAPTPSHGEGSSAAPRRELDSIGRDWQIALDTAGRALDANGILLAPTEIGTRRRRLTAERQESASLLRRLARARGIDPAPWLPAIPVTTSMLGLEQSVRGCIFDLDGVLTDSGVLHAAAWATVFDSYLLRLAHDTGRQFIPFDREADYRTYVDGRLRVEGIHAFLASRGIHLTEGLPGDDSRAETAYGLAQRKAELLERGLRQRGLAVLPGARRYLQATGYARLGRAVVSASASTRPMLELVGLEQLVEAQLDALAIRAEGLRARPAPDLLLAACHRLGLRPDEAVTLTHSGAGIVAGQRAGLAVIGIGTGPQADLLRDFGAERVVPSLSALLDPRLADAQRSERRRQS